MRGPRVTSAALWVAFAVVAVVSGWVAVQMFGSAVTPASVPVLTAGEVSARLATASPAATTRPVPATSTKQSGGPSDKPSGTSSSKPTSSPTSSSQLSSAPATDIVVRTLASRGGSVVAACSSGIVRLRSWSPAVGYRVDEVDPGPDDEAEITFVSSSSEVQMKVRCVSGVPSAETEVDDESGDDD
jgi:hypothetical protein